LIFPDFTFFTGGGSTDRVLKPYDVFILLAFVVLSNIFSEKQKNRHLSDDG